MKKLGLTLAMIAGLVCGCGYHVGSIAHPQLKSIAVAESINETAEPNVNYWVRQHCAEAIQTDGSLTLLEKSTADCILYTRILNIRSDQYMNTSTNAEITFRTRAWIMTVEIEYTLIIPGRTTPVFTKVAFGKALYQPMFDMEVSRKSAIQNAIREASNKIVERIAEGW